MRLTYASYLMRLMFVMAVALLVSVPARNAVNSLRDGNWWVEKDPTSKLYYVTGFFDGIELGHEFSYWGLPKGGEEASNVVASFASHGTKYMSGVTNSQLVQGLDVFYEDYRNRRIRIPGGVWLVLNEISGKSKDEMQKMVENYRKNAVPPE
jgi:hypothetical protein